MATLHHSFSNSCSVNGRVTRSDKKDTDKITSQFCSIDKIDLAV